MLAGTSGAEAPPRVLKQALCSPAMQHSELGAGQVGASAPAPSCSLAAPAHPSSPPFLTPIPQALGTVNSASGQRQPAGSTAKAAPPAAACSSGKENAGGGAPPSPAQPLYTHQQLSPAHFVLQQQQGPAQQVQAGQQAAVPALPPAATPAAPRTALPGGPSLVVQYGRTPSPVLGMMAVAASPLPAQQQHWQQAGAHGYATPGSIAQPLLAAGPTPSSQGSVGIGTGVVDHLHSALRQLGESQAVRCGAAVLHM